MSVRVLFAGFGGQGLLFSGKILAYKGLIEGKHLSWLPSYGPEMRGGTANCSVILSDADIPSPIFNNPDVLIAMNLPSLDKYEQKVVPGGYIFVDSAMINRKVERDDVNVFYIPATRIATDMGADGLANMVIMGHLLSKHPELSSDNAREALEKAIPARHADKIELNLKALNAGYNFSENE